MKNTEIGRVPVEAISKTSQFEERLKAGIGNGQEKVTAAKLAKKLNIKNEQLNEKLISFGYLERAEVGLILTIKGKNAGGEHKKSAKFGAYFLWPDNLQF